MLITSLSFIGVILIHIFLYANVIPLEIFIASVDIILAFHTIRYIYYRRSMQFKPRKKWKIPSPPGSPHRTENKYLARWKLMREERKMLPLDRLAFLKARYRIGPYLRYMYGKEVSIAYLKSEAEKSCAWKPDFDECHPKCYVTRMSEAYVQYRAVLYYRQGIHSVHAKHQCTFPTRISNEDLSLESGISYVMKRRYSAPPDSMEEEMVNMNGMMQCDLENYMESYKWEEFKEEMEKSKRKLEEIRRTFQQMKLQK